MLTQGDEHVLTVERARHWVSEIKGGPPVERVVIAWHVCLGMGAGLLSYPSSGPPVVLIVLFLWAATHTFGGLWLDSSKLVSRGLMLLGIASGLRAIAVWNVSQQGAGSNLIAAFTWAMIALGCGMRGAMVRHRGLTPHQSRWS